jgi:hypothetical protein
MSTMQAPQQGNEEVVTGQVTAVIAKGGDKWQVAVQPQGSQYTKNLWTKDFGLVQQMQANINSWYSFVCGASHWTNNQGQNIRSLWINSVTAPGMAQQAQPNGPMAAAVAADQQQNPYQQQQPQGQPNWQPASAAAAQPQGQPGISPMEKEERIMREHAMGVVALMLPHMAPEERNAPAMIDVAEGLVAYYRLGRAAIALQPGGPNPAYVPQPQYDGPPNPGGGSDYHPGYASQGSEDWPTPAPGQSDDIPY